MTKSKSTKRALLVSMISLVLCCAMLVGTTFAWFTDSVTTGVNKIVAGNLDVELYSRQYDKATEEYKYVPVDEETSLFDNDALWEPGHTEVVYLKVANLGTLALKYKLAVTVESETEGTNVAGDTFKLSDYLVFGQVAGTTETTYNTRAEAQAAVAEATQGLKDYSKESVLYPKDTDGKTSEEYVALVVYMPETVGNEANYKTDTAAPTIELGVTLVATQTPYESDSFNNQYDENATYPVVVASKEFDITVDGGGELTTNDGEVTVVVPEQSVENDTNAIFTMILTGTTTNSRTYEISLADLDGNTITLSNPATVTANIGTLLSDVTVYHSGVQMEDDDYSYDPLTGVLAISSTSFSPFKITYTAPQYIHNEDELDAAVSAGGDYIMANDITLAVSTEMLQIGNSFRLDLDGYTLTGTTFRLQSPATDIAIFNGKIARDENMNRSYTTMPIIEIDGVKNVALNDLYITGNGLLSAGIIQMSDKDPWYRSSTADCSVVINNCITDGRLDLYSSENSMNITANGCTFSQVFISGQDDNLTLNNTTIVGKSDKYAIRFWKEGPTVNITITGDITLTGTVENLFIGSNYITNGILSLNIAADTYTQLEGKLDNLSTYGIDLTKTADGWTYTKSDS